MSDVHPDLPPFANIQAALVAVTDRFVHELGAPEEAAPDWNDFEWGIARSVCVMHGLAGMLAGRLRWRGPESWVKFLGEQQLAHAPARSARPEILARLDDATRKHAASPSCLSRAPRSSRSVCTGRVCAP